MTIEELYLSLQNTDKRLAHDDLHVIIDSLTNNHDEILRLESEYGGTFLSLILKSSSLDTLVRIYGLLDPSIRDSRFNKDTNMYHPIMYCTARDALTLIDSCYHRDFDLLWKVEQYSETPSLLDFLLENDRDQLLLLISEFNVSSTELDYSKLSQ